MKLALALVAILFASAIAHAQQSAGNGALIVLANMGKVNGPGIVGVYATPPNDNRWGENLLGNYVVVPGGQAVIIDLRNRLSVCIFDVRVVFGNGQARQWASVNTCTQNGNIEAWP